MHQQPQFQIKSNRASPGKKFSKAHGLASIPQKNLPEYQNNVLHISKDFRKPQKNLGMPSLSPKPF